MDADNRDKPQDTTPYKGSPSDNATTEIDAQSPSLKALAERFELLGELGRGGMGIVYKARDREAGEMVALKVLKPEISARPDLIERFKAELRLARKVTHKNVCRTHDLHRFGPVAAIAMEYVEGESLRNVLQRSETLSVRHGLRIIRQVIAGLREAHAQGVVHRDLKPENIVVARDGTVKVMDFGIARSVEAGATLTASGAVMGTPAYMSPEQAEGKPADARSDIYALGLILYEMFTGQRAFEADTPVAMAVKQMQEAPAAPSELEPTLPAHIDKAILKALEKKPEKRFQSVEELEAALTQVEVKPAAAAAETPEAPLPLHLARWQRFDWFLLGLAVVSGIAFFWMYDKVYPYGALAAPFSRSEAIQKARLLLEKHIPGAKDYEYTATYQGASLGMGFPELVLEEALNDAVERLPEFTWGRHQWPGPGSWEVHVTQGADRFFQVVFDFQGIPKQVDLGRYVKGAEASPPSQEQVLPHAVRFAEETFGVKVAGAQPTSYDYESSPAAGRGWRTAGEPEHKLYAWSPATRPVEWRLPTEKPKRLRLVRIWATVDGVRGGENYTISEEPIRPRPFSRHERGWLRGTFAGVTVVGLIGLFCVILFIWRGLHRHSFPGLRVVSLAGALASVGVASGMNALPRDHGWLYAALLSVLGWLLFYAVIGVVHYYASRRVAAQLTTFLKLVREPIRATTAGLSLLRGVLLGVCCLAGHTALLLVLGRFRLAATGTLLATTPLAMGAEIRVDLWFLGPVSLSVLGTLVGAWVLVALPAALLRPVTRAATLVAGIDALWLATAFAVPGASAFPVLPLYLFAGLQGLLFAWVFLRYDLVTCVSAMFTVATWLFCYPLYRMFGRVEFWPHSLVLGPWFVMVLLGLLLWFRPELVAGWRRLVAVFE